ncbi:hypothetical protein CTI12_AA521920 [Artemisia annua]|uniref:Uncharacterized protein n=1 Tax=Artemisia annua TaxID=35608 RepID=A0A2U1L7I7_ARTAN|nr:hypothetical protein CTI12_AA521920 [Artemisia annua]
MAESWRISDTLAMGSPYEQYDTFPVVGISRSNTTQTTIFNGLGFFNSIQLQLYWSMNSMYANHMNKYTQFKQNGVYVIPETSHLTSKDLASHKNLRDTK